MNCEKKKKKKEKKREIIYEEFLKEAIEHTKKSWEREKKLHAKKS